MIMPPPGGMPPEMMQQAPMMPQQAPEQPPDPAQMHAAVVARLEELEIEKAELIGILQQMEGGAPQQMAAAPPMGPPMGGPQGLLG